MCVHFQGGLSVARKKNSSLSEKRMGLANDEGMQISDGN